MSKYGENIYRRKDGRWEARYIFMRLPDGKAKYKSVYGKTHDIAKEKQLAGMLALAKEKRPSCELTLKELFVQYLAQTDVKTSTRERYRFMLERHIIPYFGKTPASKLTAKELSAFLLHLRKNGRLDGKGGLSAKTVRDLAVLMKTLLAARIPLRLRRAEHETACLRAEKYRGSLRTGAGGHEQSPIAVKGNHLRGHAGAARGASRRRGLCAARVRYRFHDRNHPNLPLGAANDAEREVTASGPAPEKRQLRTDRAAASGIIAPAAENYREYAARRIYYDRSA